MARYRKKPIEVEAWQVGSEPVSEWILTAAPTGYETEWYVETEDGFVCMIDENWWLVKKRFSYIGVDNMNFQKTYEVIE